MFRYVRWDMRLSDRAILIALHDTETPISQKELANHLGCHYNTVYRALKRMSAYISLIEGGKGKPGIYVIHYDKLPESLRLELDT